MISIIVSTYNRLSSLTRCIESISTQKTPNLELIIVDDCSSDGTADYLLQLAEENSFIRVLVNKVNCGVNYSRNRGVEIASQKFILFLDSDDALVPGSLDKIESSISHQPATKHFLFVVSDRSEEFKNAAQTRLVQYKDWLIGNVSGDFTHVVLASIMKKYPFFEEFRMFEHLNWLRTKKETAPQLFVNIVVTDRERQRSDSLTLTSKLQNAEVIKTKFDSENMYYSLYHNDLKRYSPKSFEFKLIYTILLGIASNKRSECKSLINYAGKWPVKALGKIVMLLPGSLVQFGIIRYSNMKQY
jgi:glycosyltransferase involved in cell wall biosynthesis